MANMQALSNPRIKNREALGEFAESRLVHQHLAAHLDQVVARSKLKILEDLPELDARQQLHAIHPHPAVLGALEEERRPLALPRGRDHHLSLVPGGALPVPDPREPVDALFEGLCSFKGCLSAMNLGRWPACPDPLLYVDALERIGTPPAIDALVDGTLQDPDEEIFHACLEKILRLRPPNVEKRYVAALRDEINLRVNRAAYALGQLRETSVLSPLIGALVTTHTIVIPKASDAYTATFARTDGGSPLGGTGFSAGGEPLVISQTVNNQEVLTALIRLSGGVNYGFDKQAWQYWLDNENQRSTPAVNARRGGP